MADKAAVTTIKLVEMKQKGIKITALTAYDTPSARLLNEAGVDVVLVGDSVGMVKLGYESTIPVTMDEMLHHVKAAKRGNSRALLVADMPYLSYELDVKETLRNAGRLMKEGGAHAVKLEGGIETAPMIKELLKINIPVMGHLGLTPQAVNRLGGYKVQGRKPQEAEHMLTEAKILEGAGAFAVVLECVPPTLAREITRKLSIPTIGIGAGSHCDGQILVLDDMLGLSDGPELKFVKRYADLRRAALAAVAAYAREVRDGSFPAAEHEFADRINTLR
ncbi:MAG: 3-methyl-2-oxobutanoate hydroxymethyltransferase [Elusimicrobia bacterium RIFCSPHIGHO2_02_FULL_57_9]|nr:MAG: 3-methyl-2-oxobutanoate hydroxymethyltransferase [Elusimicrobia bacterium RIFCSPHIGHO2_02_FULL_57_9]